LRSAPNSDSADSKDHFPQWPAPKIADPLVAMPAGSGWAKYLTAFWDDVRFGENELQQREIPDSEHANSFVFFCRLRRSTQYVCYN
jgi:hypothetical protein